MIREHNVDIVEVCENKQGGGKFLLTKLFTFVYAISFSF